MDLYSIKAKCLEYPIVFWGLLFSFFLALIIFFRSGTLPELTQEYENLSRKRKIVDYNVINSVGIEGDIEKQRELNKVIIARLLDPQKRADVYHYFFAMEGTTGIHIDNPRQFKIEKINYKSVVGVQPGAFPQIATITYKLDVSGTFEQLMKFIYMVQRGTYFVRISEFTLGRSESLQADVLLMNLSIDCFGIFPAT